MNTVAIGVDLIIIGTGALVLFYMSCLYAGKAARLEKELKALRNYCSALENNAFSPIQSKYRNAALKTVPNNTVKNMLSKVGKSQSHINAFQQYPSTIMPTTMMKILFSISKIIRRILRGVNHNRTKPKR